MIKDYDQAISCLDKAIHTTIISKNALDMFSRYYLEDKRLPRLIDCPEYLLELLSKDHERVTSSIRRMKNWSETDAPDIHKYGRAKLFSKKRWYNGLVRLLSKDKSGLNMRLAESDYADYMEHIATYNHEFNFTEKNMKRLIGVLNSYIYNLSDMVEKFAPYYSRNVIHKDFNIVLSTCIDLHTFKENAPEVMRFIINEKMRKQPQVYKRLESILKKERPYAYYSNV